MPLKRDAHKQVRHTPVRSRHPHRDPEETVSAEMVTDGKDLFSVLASQEWPDHRNAVFT